MKTNSFLLILGLLFPMIGFAQKSQITMKTSKAVGDIFYLRYSTDSFDINSISVQGAIKVGFGEYKLTSNIVVIGGDVESLDCGYNSIVTLDISQNKNLKYLVCDVNSLDSLNISENNKLETLKCDYNSILALDVSKNVKLKELKCGGNQLDVLDVSENKDLEILNCSHNQLTFLDISNNERLYALGCEENQLTVLDVSKNKMLSELLCSNNQLNSIDLAENKELSLLYCSDNNLSVLDLSGLGKLAELQCANNDLTTLDLSHKESLCDVRLYGNKFSACELDNIFRQLPIYKYDYPALILVKDKDVPDPGADGCRGYLATEKNWDVLMHVSSGNDYLHVEEINNAGHYVCSNPMSISKINNAFILHPNPVTNSLYIEGDLNLHSVTLFTVGGILYKKVRMSETKGQHSVDLSDLSSGLYILHIHTENGTEIHKILKR